MSGVVLLTLDTRAPEVTWGALTGTTAGELLRVAYTLDEPELLDATLQLPGGEQLAMAVLDDRLEVLLPPATAQGAATLRARVRDEVGNAEIVELTIPVQGATGPPAQGQPRARPSSWSRPRSTEPERRLVTGARSRVRGDSHDRLTIVAASVRSSVHTASRDRTTARTVGASTAAVSSASRLVTLAGGGTARAGTASTAGVVGRRDGQALEEALLLDLL